MKNHKSPKAVAAKADFITPILFMIAAAALGALFLLNNASAAIARAGNYTCEDRISNLYLAGSFKMPGSGDAMNLWIGKPRALVAAADDKGEVWGLVGKSGADGCEAQCKVKRFERFKKDLKPALMEMDCEGMRLKTMRMPLHVQWLRDKDGFEPIVRLGSSVYGMEQAALRIQVNRYDMVATNATAISGIAKK